MTTTTIDRAFMKTARARIDEALATVADDLGIEIKTGSGSYDREGRFAKLALDLAVKGGDGVTLDRSAIDFQRYATRWGMEPGDLGARMDDQQGEVLRIVGGRPRASKYPIVLETESTGERLCFAAPMVRAMLGRYRID